jgi:hypothetical protein
MQHKSNPRIPLHCSQLLIQHLSIPHGRGAFTAVNHPLIFELQYLRLKTTLPPMMNVYGLGEHTEPFRLDVTNTTRTLRSRDAFGIPRGTVPYEPVRQPSRVF